MKKIFYSGIIIFSLLSTGCEDDLKLTPLDSTTQETSYSSETDIEQAVNGIYKGMVDGGTVGGFAINIYTLLSEIRSNNYESVTTDGATDWYDIGRFQETSSTDVLDQVWEDCYQVIYYANEVIENIDAVSFDDENLKSRYKAEARFLRAYAHFELLRIFGKVPLIDHVVTISEAKTIDRTDLDTLYDWIASELEAASDDLYAKYDDEDLGRATKWAAHSLLGRVFLTRAGYPLQETTYLDSAKVHLKTVIDQEGTYITWCDNYADLFQVDNENKYDIFEIEHESGGLNAGTFLPSYIGPSFGTADPRYNVNGSILYSSDRIPVTDDLIESYEEGDLRFAATIDTVYINSNGVEAKSQFFVKYPREGLTISSRYDWPNNFPVIRYADVLLMYAEILNDEGSTASAVPYLNRIRERAGLSDYSTSISQSEFQTALEKERRIEFADEGIYWHDLVRWDKAVDVMNDWFDEIGEDITIDQDNYIYYIPLSQIQACGYEQNP